MIAGSSVGLVSGVITLRDWYRSKRKPEVTREEFRRIRDDQREHRALLSRLAYRLPEYRRARQLEARGVHLLCHKWWIPEAPIDLGNPGPDLMKEPKGLTTRCMENVQGGDKIQRHKEFWRVAAEKLPRDAQGRLHRAILAHDEHARLTSESCYSMLAPPGRRRPGAFTFGLAKYFDYIDVGEALAYEFTRELTRRLGTPRQELEKFKPPPALLRSLGMRRAAGAWHNVAFRPSLTGINCLTILAHEAGPTFAFMRREEVESAQNTWHVVPAGEFQPTLHLKDQPVLQCRLWQTVLREFAEELLDVPEAQGDNLTLSDLAAIAPIAEMLRCIENGTIKAWFLGWGLDPLTLKPEILVALVMTRSVYVTLRIKAGSAPGGKVDGLLSRNLEGRMLPGETPWGHRLSEKSLQDMASDPHTLPAGVGCLRLAAPHVERFLREVRS